MSSIWQRLDSGRPVGLAADQAPTPPEGLARLPVRVRCGPERDTLADAQARLNRLADASSLIEAAGARLRQGLRRRLLGEPDPEARVVEALNHAEAVLDPPRYLVLEGVERADPRTLTVLLRAAQNPGWLRMPVLAVFRRIPATGPAARLAELLGVESDAIESAPVAFEEAPWLSPAAARTLRAAALLGPGFHVDTLATLLRAEPLAVLEHLQEAVDAGIPLHDAGDGSMRMSEEMAAQLQQGILPALREAWLSRLGEIGVEPVGQRAPNRPTSEPRLRARAEPRAARPPSEGEPDDREIARLIVSAREAFVRGDTQQALSLAGQGVAVLEALEPTPARRRSRVVLYADLAQYKREFGGRTPGSTLAEALTLAEAATDLLDPGDPAELAAGVHALVGSLRYDLGDPDSLAAAIEAYTIAITLLEGADQPVAAARLLNDQAAVYTRLGDPVRAAHLLRTSRTIFEEADGLEARLEIAETDHLLARLPFHVAAREGHEAEAIEAALEHARSAAAIYEAEDQVLDLARVWETLGRLELRRSDLDTAVDWLMEAVEVQQRIGDVLGLARTTAALSTALARAGRHSDALTLLGDSVAMNLRQGTPLGLAHNRAALEELREKADGSQALAARLDQVEERLEQAEAVVGRTDAPPSYQ